jgi:hypothetical protein
MTDEADPFYCLGSMRLFEARKLVARLEEERIRFELEDHVSTTTDVLNSVVLFGSGVSSDGPEVKVFIHRDDERKFRKISGEFFKV